MKHAYIVSRVSVRAKTTAVMCVAPAARKVRAASNNDAPVVITSSTNTMC
jgi:hypothetical protein